MESFETLIYIFLGVIWLFKLIAKKKRAAEREQRPGRREPEPERDIFENIKDLMEKGRQADTESYPEPPDFFEEAEPKIEFQKAGKLKEIQTDESERIEGETTLAPVLEEPAAIQPPSKEFSLKKIFDKNKPEADLSAPQVKTFPASYLNNLPGDVLERGIILSVILGPPKSVQMMKRIGVRNINSDNY